MNDFFEIYKTQIIQSLIVIVMVIILRYITILFYNIGIRRIQKKYNTRKPRSISWVKSILKALWVILGFFALGYIFIEGDFREIAKLNFQRTVILAFIAIATIIISAFTNLWFKSRISELEFDSKDPTNLKFLRYVVIILIYFIGSIFMLYTIPSMRYLANTAIGGAGVLTIVIGIASQEAFANIIGGIFIVAFKPFRVGDTIMLQGGLEGSVVDITLRHTVVKDYDNKMIVIPNSVISKERLINFDLRDPRCCNRIEFDISVDSDMDLAKHIMQEECEKHPLILDMRTPEMSEMKEPIARTAITKVEDGSVTVRVWAWSNSFSENFKLKCDVLESIKRRFDEEGIELAYPYRTQLRS